MRIVARQLQAMHIVVITIKEINEEEIIILLIVLPKLLYIIVENF